MAVSAKRLEELLLEHRGNMAKVAEALGITRQAVSKRVRNNRRLSTVRDDAHESRIDQVEDALFKNAIEGNVAAQIFIMKTQAKGRGYVERQEVTGADGRAVPIVVISADDYEAL